MDSIDAGLLAMRVVVGFLIVGHGFGNLFGWLGGFGLDGTGEIFERLGFRPGRFFAGVTGGLEVAIGVLLVLGWLTPLTTSALVGLMVTTIFTAHAGKGPWYFNGGWEFNLTLLTIGVALGLVGPGGASLDAAFGPRLWGWGWGGAAILVGLAAGLLSLTLRRGLTEPLDEDAA